MAVTPPVDVLTSTPYDVVNDLHFASLMVAVLIRMPLLVIMAPVCRWWSKANDFNASRAGAQQHCEKKREEQQ